MGIWGSIVNSLWTWQLVPIMFSKSGVFRVLGRGVLAWKNMGGNFWCSLSTCSFLPNFPLLFLWGWIVVFPCKYLQVQCKYKFMKMTFWRYSNFTDMHHTEIQYVKVARTHCSSKLLHVTPMIAKASNFQSPKVTLLFQCVPCVPCVPTLVHTPAVDSKELDGAVCRVRQSQSRLKGSYVHEALAVHILLDPLATSS